jgi:magnesium transporter
MITVFGNQAAGAGSVTLVEGGALPAGAVWIDLLDPSAAERDTVERAVGVSLPTREEMQEIEPSSRLYSENGVLFLTATALVRADEPDPDGDPITFVLTKDRLVTIHYTELWPVRACAERLQRGGVTGADDILIALLDTFIDRIADLLERASSTLDEVSKRIFAAPGRRVGRQRADRPDLQVALRRLGHEEDIISTARESLLSLNRAVRFASPVLMDRAKAEGRDIRGALRDLRADIASLAEHATFESGKISFLLSASLGMINMDQNRIIKIFSIVAVVLLPPTLVATIYGMNFAHMPELAWHFGYPMALVTMVVSAILPYLYFRHRNWL